MSITLITVFLSTLTVTSYRSIPSQTDSSPWITSIGERVSPRGCAVSPDLLKKNGGPLNYGDLVYVEGIGFKFVNDVMNKRNRNAVDIWVRNYSEEKKIGVQKQRVFLIKIQEEKLCPKPIKKCGIIAKLVDVIRGVFWKKKS